MSFVNPSLFFSDPFGVQSPMAFIGLNADGSTPMAMYAAPGGDPNDPIPQPAFADLTSPHASAGISYRTDEAICSGCDCSSDGLEPRFAFARAGVPQHLFPLLTLGRRSPYVTAFFIA